MKRFASSLIAFGLIASTILPGLASAQTTVQTSLTNIQALTNQIKALQEQINALQRQQTQLQASSTQAVLEIIQNLKEGSAGDQVTLLQTLLSLDPAIYPEGKVTGIFGPLTRRALERFQSRLGLEAVGFVGPRTRAELNKLIREQFKVARDLENDIDDDVAKNIEDAIGSITLPPLPSDPCGIPGLPFASTTSPWIQKDGKTKIIQTGNVFIYQDGKHKIIITPNTYIEKDGKKQLLITPGMRIEKDGKFKSIIPCNGATSTFPFPTPNDTTPPVISFINSSVTHQGATISWITDESATSKIYYGTTSPVNLGSASSTANSTLQTGHSLSLTGLSASTTYFFVVESKDKKGNTATSSEKSLKTSSTPDSIAPMITAISTSGIGTSSATISWTTNESANSKIYYGTSTPLNTGTALTKIDGAFVTNHSLSLGSLVPNTTYYFKVESADGSSNASLASETSFTTALLPADTIAPVISALSTTPASTTAQVTWMTNEAATSKIYYGTTTPLVLGSASTVSNGAFLTSHSLNLLGLTASTTYFMVVESKDAANNTATSSETSFGTGN